MPGTGVLFPFEYFYEWHGHPVVAGSERSLILPDAADTKLILKVRPHTRKVLHPSIPQTLQFARITNSRLHQHFGVDRT